MPPPATLATRRWPAAVPGKAAPTHRLTIKIRAGMTNRGNSSQYVKWTISNNAQIKVATKMTIDNATAKRFRNANNTANTK